MLFRAGPRFNRQRISIQGGNEFLSSLTPITDWTILDFSNDLLPKEFRVAFGSEGLPRDTAPAIALRP